MDVMWESNGLGRGVAQTKGWVGEPGYRQDYYQKANYSGDYKPNQG